MMEEEENNRSREFDPRIHANMLIINNIMTLFKKHVAFDERNSDTCLPCSENMFKEPPWLLDNLQTLKNDLNEVKSRLNNFNLYEWQKHTNQMNKAGYVVNTVRERIQPELLTQAWCKFYEIASSFPLVPLNEIRCDRNGNKFTSVHLCEAPGAFVAALNHWLKTNVPDVQWDWLATTLNPYCEGNSYSRMIADDRFIRHTLKHWCFGADNTGNIMDLRNLDALVESSKSLNEQGPILLVTADGSIDCTDVPGEQESTVAQLHLCETVACMHLLDKGGNFLLKLFTLFEHQSVCLMYLLYCTFREVIVTKPACSKSGNSEMYVICMNFVGRHRVAPYLNILRHYYGDVSPAEAMFNLRDISDNFLQRIEDCNKFFKRLQCETIEDNINAFRTERYNDILFELSYVKRLICTTYVSYCDLKQMVPTNEIVGREKIEKSNNCFVNKKFRVDSYNERCKTQNLESRERLLQIWREAQKIESPIEKSYIWHLRTLPEASEIQTGKLFNKVRSSRFCDSGIQQILNNIDNIVQDMHSTVCFPPAEIAKKLTQQIDANYEILSFQFVHDYDSHQTIIEICNRLEKLQTGQTLVLVGYSLLTQLNVGLLCLLGNFFNETVVEIRDNEGYRIKLETYRRNEKVLNHMREILTASYNARKVNKTIWSIMPMMILYECEQFPMIMQLNHLMIKLYAHHVINMIEDNKK